MTLGELITALEAEDPTKVVAHGFAGPHAYRGYYHEVAFEPAGRITVGEMLADAYSAVGETYEGWKGGYYTMSRGTDCWISMEGCCSDDELTPERLASILAEVAA